MMRPLFGLSVESQSSDSSHSQRRSWSAAA